MQSCSNRSSIFSPHRSSLKSEKWKLYEGPSCRDCSCHTTNRTHIHISNNPGLFALLAPKVLYFWVFFYACASYRQKNLCGYDAEVAETTSAKMFFCGSGPESHQQVLGFPRNILTIKPYSSAAVMMRFLHLGP